MSLMIGMCKDPSCGRELVPQRVWQQEPVVRQPGRACAAAHGLCATCYGRAQRFGTLPDAAPRGFAQQRAAEAVAAYIITGAPLGPGPGSGSGHRAGRGPGGRLAADEISRLRRLVGLEVAS